MARGHDGDARAREAEGGAGKKPKGRSARSPTRRRPASWSSWREGDGEPEALRAAGASNLSGKTVVDVTTRSPMRLRRTAS